MAKSERADSETSAAPERQGVPPVIRHDFGYRLTVPAAWEVEYTPKVNMKGGTVVYITPRGNIFFVVFGDLDEVKSRYKTIEDFSRTAARKLPTRGEIAGKAESSGELSICGHKALLSNVHGGGRAGGLADVWMLDFWCEESKRNYSIYGELSQSTEFPYFPRVFTYIAESFVCHGTDADAPRQGWQWADVGYSIRASLWFLQLFDYSNLLEFYQTRNVIIKTGTGVQYEWPQRGAKPMWHVRERVVPHDVKRVYYDEEGALVIEQVPDARTGEDVPENYASITYAYSLSTSRGFVEFRDAGDKVIKKIDERSIVVENLTHRTVGVFPHIRLKASRDDIERIIVTNTTIVIQGKKPS